MRALFFLLFFGGAGGGGGVKTIAVRVCVLSDFIS